MKTARHATRLFPRTRYRNITRCVKLRRSTTDDLRGPTMPCCGSRRTSARAPNAQYSVDWHAASAPRSLTPHRCQQSFCAIAALPATVDISCVSVRFAPTCIHTHALSEQRHAWQRLSVVARSALNSSSTTPPMLAQALHDKIRPFPPHMRTCTWSQSSACEPFFLRPACTGDEADIHHHNLSSGHVRSSHSGASSASRIS